MPRATLQACSSSCFWASPRRPGSVATSWGLSLSPGSRPGSARDDHLLFIAARGRYSFKVPPGPSGSFERLALAGRPHHPFPKRGPCPARRAGGGGCARAARGGPLVVRAGEGFRPAEPFRLQLIPGRDGEGRPGHALLEIGYRLGALPGAGTASRRRHRPGGRSGSAASPTSWSLARHSPRSRACSSSRTVWRGGGGSGRGCGSPSSCSPFCGSAGTLRPSSRSSTC